MTVQVSKGMTAADGISLDAPIFDPQAFRLNDEQAAIIATARELGQTVFAGRAATYIEIEDAGHLVNLERPAAFNAALDRFLKANTTATEVTA